MKTKKRTILISAFVILAVAATLFGKKVTSEKSFEYMELQRIAKTEGLAKIIVELDVPDIYKLTAASTQYKTGIEDVSYVQAAGNADLDLERAISTVTDRVLYKISGCDYEISQTYSTVPCLALSVSSEALVKLSSMPEVLSIREDIPRRLPETFKSAEIEGNGVSQPQIDVSRKIVGAEDAWSMGYTGDGWYVAILDSGIRRTHEFFTGKKIVEQCYSRLKDCPNGQSSMSGTGAAAHIENRFDHGTHVSGIAAGNNQKDNYGVAKDADIMAVQVFSYIPSWDDIGSYDSDQIKGLEYVYSKRNTYKIAAINMSLGGAEYYSVCDSDNASMKAVVDNLKSVGIATVSVSGNSGYCNAIDSPGCISTVIAVCGSDKYDKHWRYASWHPTMVDVMAPAKDINSSTADSNTSYASWNGTSMAAPHVTGAWAILKQFDPNMTVNKALQLLKDEGKPITSLCDSSKTNPRIDVAASIMSMMTIAPPLNFAGEQEVNRSLLMSEYINVLTWEANPQNTSNGQNIVKYAIYTVTGTNNLTLLTEVDSNTFTYTHRMLSHSQYKYAIKSINAKGTSSTAAYVTVASY